MAEIPQGSRGLGHGLVEQSPRPREPGWRGVDGRQGRDRLPTTIPSRGKEEAGKGGQSHLNGTELETQSTGLESLNWSEARREMTSEGLRGTQGSSETRVVSLCSRNKVAFLHASL